MGAREAAIATSVGSMRITVELRTESAAEKNCIPVQPGHLATLSGSEWSVPVSIRAISASTSEAEDREARRLLGPGYVLDDDAEEWAAVIVTADVARLLRLGLHETARMIEQGEG